VDHHATELGVIHLIAMVVFLTDDAVHGTS
jgi:hypothetical protein